MPFLPNGSYVIKSFYKAIAYIAYIRSAEVKKLHCTRAVHKLNVSFPNVFWKFCQSQKSLYRSTLNIKSKNMIELMLLLSRLWAEKLISEHAFIYNITSVARVLSLETETVDFYRQRFCFMNLCFTFKTNYWFQYVNNVKPRNTKIAFVQRRDATKCFYRLNRYRFKLQSFRKDVLEKKFEVFLI